VSGTGFAHRALYGWISEYANRPLPGVWPQIPLDDEILRDLDGYFDLCRDVGYNEIGFWGLFVDRRWPADIASAVDDDRRARVQRLLDAAHSRGLKVVSGLGLYSWGFEAIIEANPHLSRGNHQAMCPSVPESHVWMDRVLDFVLGFEIDGLNMQSADQGRCPCEECAPLSDVAYHARLNTRVAEYINARWPGKTLVMDNWGCPFSDPDQRPHLVAMSQQLSYIIDQSNSAQRAGTDYRKELVAALHCDFGTLAGRSIWPPQRWPRDKWFVPATVTNVDYIRALQAAGGRAVEQFVTTLANPSGEVSLRFMGRLLADPSADPDRLLGEAVEATYQPRDPGTRRGLMDVVRAAEHAFFTYSHPPAGTDTGLIEIDGGLFPKEEPSEERYLRRMSEENLAAYGDAIAAAARNFEKLRAGIRPQQKADLTARCLATVLADVARIRAQQR
jgi:hypothetical protein